MEGQYNASLSISLRLQCQVKEDGELPDLQQFANTFCQGSPITGCTVWGTPTWERYNGPWQELSVSPFESGDLVIHVCRRDGVGRTLLARCVQDEQEPRQLLTSYLPNAEEEVVERAVWEYMRATYPSHQDGFFPCPEVLANKYGSV